ncbi:hypothetical protein BKA67DRAFT_263391 [Truncatella angustata]|uniref:Uncharacterized protein n=1 Tax=Truncatella angustata TaxID=152316 RepID=A0A9P8ZX99_9PEZI|nr:uncharacterized protein BKA67DRAFT_263391 [Truncatella angustata]KAH6653883.1 hypothetical protein BKA67DRAFT_263391 [Truncatella angustata]
MGKFWPRDAKQCFYFYYNRLQLACSVGYSSRVPFRSNNTQTDFGNSYLLRLLRVAWAHPASISHSHRNLVSSGSWTLARRYKFRLAAVRHKSKPVGSNMGTKSSSIKSWVSDDKTHDGSDGVVGYHVSLTH